MTQVIVDLDDFYSVQVAADELGIGIATAWRWVKSNKLIVIRLAGRTLVPKSEIERLRNRGTP